MEYIKLSNGVGMPLLGYGVFLSALKNVNAASATR